MSYNTIVIIVTALFVLAVITGFAGQRFGIFDAAETTPDDDFTQDGDDDEYDDDYDEYDDDYDEYDDEDEDDAVVFVKEIVPVSPAFLMKFSEAYIEELSYTRSMRLKSFAPHLYAPDWYETTKREFSMWSVKLRKEYAIAC
jgi:hypothetical protein